MASYGNFSDPVGLLRRMVVSGNRAARFTLVREALSFLMTPVDLMLLPFERRFVRASKETDLPLVLVIGGSRNGTTLVYQTLVRYLPVSYFDNLSACFPRSPITAKRIVDKAVRGERGQINFESYFGNASGFFGPNDGFHIWNRWLGKDRYAVPASVSGGAMVGMKRFVQAWHTASQKPLVNKNNRNSLCLELFAAAFESVLFVEIRRDPVYVAQSLIEAREIVQGSRAIPWGLASHETTREEHELSYIDEVCRQVFKVNTVLDDARRDIDPRRYIRIWYEDFCRDPARFVREISERIFGRVMVRPEVDVLGPFENANRRRLTEGELERIEIRLAELKRAGGSRYAQWQGHAHSNEDC